MATALPTAPGAKHVAAFQRGDWTVARIKGSHHIMVKEGHEAILSVPCHRHDMKRGTLRSLIKAAGLTVDQYVALFDG